MHRSYFAFHSLPPITLPFNNFLPPPMMLLLLPSMIVLAVSFADSSLISTIGVLKTNPIKSTSAQNRENGLRRPSIKLGWTIVVSRRRIRTSEVDIPIKDMYLFRNPIHHLAPLVYKCLRNLEHRRDTLSVMVPNINENITKISKSCQYKFKK